MESLSRTAHSNAAQAPASNSEVRRAMKLSPARSARRIFESSSVSHPVFHVGAKWLSPKISTLDLYRRHQLDQTRLCYPSSRLKLPTKSRNDCPRRKSTQSASP